MQKEALDKDVQDATGWLRQWATQEGTDCLGMCTLYIKNRMKWGATHAERVMEELERRSVVSAADGNGFRMFNG